MLLLCALFATALLAPRVIRWLGRNGFYLLALPLLAGAVWTGSYAVSYAKDSNPHLFDVSTTDSNATPADFPTESIAWMPQANLGIDLRLDPLAALFATLVLGIGFLILVYCGRYFDPLKRPARRTGAFAGQMVGFAAAMYGLVIADGLLLMYIFWEITSVLSFLLVGYYAERASSRRAAGQALMVTTLGGLAMLVGLILLGFSTDTWLFSELTARGADAVLDQSTLGTPAVATALVLIVAGALSKSAIAPFHFWLPGAMAAPTPVSAYLHSAAMVKAGVFLIARLAPTFSSTASWHLAIIPLGLITMVMAGWMALRQLDLKLILAYGTVSQLGFIVSVAAIGTRPTMLAALALTFGHALFKATLFMVVGIIDHHTGTRDVRELSGLGRRRPELALTAMVAAASMAGLPPMLGFVAKESVLTTVLGELTLRGMPALMMTTTMVIGSVLTMAYSMYFLFAAFGTKTGAALDADPDTGASPAVRDMTRPGFGIQWPAWLLAGASVVFGLVPQVVETALTPYLTDAFPTNGVGLGVSTAMELADAAAPDPTAFHLALWHGFTVPLGLTVLIIVGGAVLAWQRKTALTLQPKDPALGDADAAYDAVLRGAQRLSLRATSLTQRGSLPLNEAVILVTLALAAVAGLSFGELPAIRMEPWESPIQALVAGAIIVAAVAATRINNRLSGVILVGVTGYGLAVLFALHGAPDLALTQLLVETIVMIVFVLVLRKLPASVDPNATVGHTRMRGWLGIAIGTIVAIVGAFAISARAHDPVSTVIPDLAKNIGHGANAVNVLLVDIRAFDTLGEVSVLVIVAVGVASLVFRTPTARLNAQAKLGQRRAARRAKHNAASRAASDAASNTASAEGRAERHSESRSERRRGARPRWLTIAQVNKPIEGPLMLEVSTRFLFPAMMVLSLYFFFSGHNAPGGGFAGGLVAGLALTLRYLTGGRQELNDVVPIETDRIIALGLVLVTLGALIPMYFGYPPLTSAYFTLTVPLIGDVTVVSALGFDAGVYLIVVGMVVYFLRSLGGRIDVESEIRAERARSRRVSLSRLSRQGQKRNIEAAVSVKSGTKTSTSPKER